jgi:hypothetical protein
MTDFLEALEDELRGAAERRGQPRRRRPPTGALKAIAAVAVVALLVTGIARLANDTDTEQPASPAPTANRDKVVYATAGDPALLELLSARARGYHPTEIADGENLADPSLGTVVLYRPRSEELARELASAAKIDTVRRLTKEDAAQLQADVSKAGVVVVYGPGNDERLLADPDVCASAGGALKLCVDRSDERRSSVFVLDDTPLAVEPVDKRGWWSWAALSPDGQTILAQWHADCPQAFMIDPATAERRELGPGQALGWTTDGRAILAGACGDDGHYFISPDGTREPWAGPKDRMEPSTTPLDVGE